MLEIELGEYIRTKQDGIKQVKKIEYDKEYKENYYYFDNVFGVWEIDILKHSKNIIDLVEIGDLIVLEYYVVKYKKRIMRKFEIFRNDNLISFENAHCSFLYNVEQKKWVDGSGYNVKIKQILTREQYEQNCYKVD